MYHLTQVETAADASRFCGVASLTPLNQETRAAQAPDASYVVSDGRDDLARCSVWWSTTLPYQRHQVGVVGHYAARDPQAAECLLSHACASLAAHGCTLAVGPMDGDTFHTYRFVTEGGTEPPFFLEPRNPEQYPQHFLDSDFRPLARYCSALQTNLHARQPHIAAIESRLASRGVRIRPLNPARFEDEVQRIYTATTECFASAPFFAPISAARFLELYRPLQPLLVPELVLVAEREERLVGFLFAIPDRLQALRGERMDTVIVKTIGVVPAFMRSGLVGLLLARGIETAHALGYTRAIHALMHEHNTSVRLSERYAGHPIRRYTLFARALEPA